MEMFFGEEVKAAKAENGVITKDMVIADIVNADPENTKILMECGMHCIGCPSSQMETLEEACNVHGLNVEDLLAKLNK